MKTLTKGYKYELDYFEVETKPKQILQFIEKVPESEGSTTFRTVNNGTTNEEVLAVLIDRISFLQRKHPCRENEIVITKLEESLFWLNKRTADRVARAVEGTNAK